MAGLLSNREPVADDSDFQPQGERLAAPAQSDFMPDPNKWYFLKADYKRNGKVETGYFWPVGNSFSRSFWDYIEMLGGTHSGPYTACQLQFTQIEDGPWYHVKVRADGWHLSMKATGYVYRASQYKSGFMISHGKLYIDYWPGPLGCANNYGLMPDVYFVGADFPDNVLGDVELVEVT